MTRLINTIQDLLEIPSLEAGEPVMDGCFFINPFMTSSFKGNGQIQDTKLHLALNMFYSSKADIVTNTMSLLTTLSSNNRYAISDPDYTYFEDADMWQSTMNIIIIGGN